MDNSRRLSQRFSAKVIDVLDQMHSGGNNEELVCIEISKLCNFYNDNIIPLICLTKTSKLRGYFEFLNMFEYSE